MFLLGHCQPRQEPCAMKPRLDDPSLRRWYAESALMNRISLANVFQAFPLEHGNWTAWEEQWGDLMRGVNLPFGPQGATLTTVKLPSGWLGVSTHAWLREWHQYFATNGWADKLFYYGPDEPTNGSPERQVRATP